MMIQSKGFNDIWEKKSISRITKGKTTDIDNQMPTVRWAYIRAITDKNVLYNREVCIKQRKAQRKRKI